MLSKREEVIVLLESRGSWHKGIKSQFSSFGAVPGEKATERRPCKSCGESGKVNTRKGLEDCVNCQGKGSFLVDAYTEKREQQAEVKTLSGPEREHWRRTTDASITRLKQQTAPPRTDADLIAQATPYQWERDRDRHYKAGSYHELDQALEWLTCRAPQARSLIGWVYESGAGSLGCLDASIVTAAELAVDVLADRMPDPIRVPQWLRPRTEAQVTQIRNRTQRSRAA